MPCHIHRPFQADNDLVWFSPLPSLLFAGRDSVWNFFRALAFVCYADWIGHCISLLTCKIESETCVWLYLCGNSLHIFHRNIVPFVDHVPCEIYDYLSANAHRQSGAIGFRWRWWFILLCFVSILPIYIRPIIVVVAVAADVATAAMHIYLSCSLCVCTIMCQYNCSTLCMQIVCNL